MLRTLTALLIIGMLTLTLVAAPVAAQEGDTNEATATSESSDPEANLPYLFAVYTVTWGAFFAYLFYLSQKQRDLRREVESLRQALAGKEGRDESTVRRDT